MSGININPVSANLMNENMNVKVTPSEAQNSFSTYLSEALNTVNNYQGQSDKLTTKLVNGEDVNIEEVMIAAQKASVTLNLTMEVRNKAVEAYQEIMRMSV